MEFPLTSNKIIKLISLAITSATVCLFTLIVCYFIGERFFFNKLFFQKSTSHGYIIPGNNGGEPDYRDRAKYLGLLGKDPIVLGASSDEFTILIIGDSYAWGEGIRNSQRFPYLLEKRLNKIRPTRVITLAYPGWNISEYADAYLQAARHITPDLTIVSLVHNDVLLNVKDTKDEALRHCEAVYPKITPVYEPATNDQVALVQNTSWNNEINLCHLDIKLAKLPAEKSIYFITDNYTENPLYDEYTKHLKYLNKYVLNSNIAKSIPKYQKIWEREKFHKLVISDLEMHPSSFAHSLYADVIYREITESKSIGFKK